MVRMAWLSSASFLNGCRELSLFTNQISGTKKISLWYYAVEISGFIFEAAKVALTLAGILPYHKRKMYSMVHRQGQEQQWNGLWRLER